MHADEVRSPSANSKFKSTADGIMKPTKADLEGVGWTAPAPPTSNESMEIKRRM